MKIILLMFLLDYLLPQNDAKHRYVSTSSSLVISLQPCYQLLHGQHIHTAVLVTCSHILEFFLPKHTGFNQCNDMKIIRLL